MGDNNKVTVMKNEEYRTRPLPKEATKLSELSLLPQQDQFFKAYIQCKFHLAKTLKRSKITRGMYYNWIENYPHFSKAIEVCRDRFVDTIEDAFKDLVEDKNPQAIMFGLKTLARARGYAEKQDLNVTGIAGIKVVFDDVTDK